MSLKLYGIGLCTNWWARKQGMEARSLHSKLFEALSHPGTLNPDYLCGGVLFTQSNKKPCSWEPFFQLCAEALVMRGKVHCDSPGGLGSQVAAFEIYSVGLLAWRIGAS